MTEIKLDCSLRGIRHDWKRREARYEERHRMRSTQSAGFFWRCERCGKETDTDERPAD
jgi:hypothetical protein